MEIDQESLENALNNVDREVSGGVNVGECGEEKHACGCEEKCDDCECDSNEEIGFHKGALNTLAAERNELVKMVQNVEAIMQAHLKRLGEMGVEIKGQSGEGSEKC